METVRKYWMRENVWLEETSETTVSKKGVRLSTQEGRLLPVKISLTLSGKKAFFPPDVER